MSVGDYLLKTKKGQLMTYTNFYLSSFDYLKGLNFDRLNVADLFHSYSCGTVALCWAHSPEKKEQLQMR